jgi:hypothetical protein
MYFLKKETKTSILLIFLYNFFGCLFEYLWSFLLCRLIRTSNELKHQVRCRQDAAKRHKPAFYETINRAYLNNSSIPKVSQGTYVISSTTKAIIKRKGKASRATTVSGFSKRKDAKNRFIPTGGVR